MVVEAMYANLLTSLDCLLEAVNSLLYIGDLAVASHAGACRNLRGLPLRQLQPALVSAVLFPAGESLKHSVHLWSADFALL